MNVRTAQGAHIMVVDDTPANLRLLDDLLRGQGYQVRLFPRGALALKAAAGSPPDLILLDIMMPEMDGFELCRRLKQLPAVAEVPVIFISALAETDHKVRAFAEGGLDYITKPFEKAEVLSRVATHLALHTMRQAAARHQALLEQTVRERTDELLRAQRVGRIGSWKLDLASQALTWSPETSRLFGLPDDASVTWDDHLAKVHPEDRETVRERWQLALQGKSFDVEHRVTGPAGAQWVRQRAEFDPDAAGRPAIAWGTVQDISEIKAQQAQVDFITHHDALTGLPNRARFIEMLRLCMSQCRTLRKQLAVAYIDLDSFASLDGQLGREDGNRLLVELARRLAQAVRDRQLLARIGGDEFAVALPDLRSLEDAAVPVQRLLQTVARPLELDGRVLHVTASIGVTLYPQPDDVEAEQLLRQADQAMYLAKLAGKNRQHVFDPRKDESTRERFLRIEAVRHALEQGQMRLYFQPKVWLGSGQVAGFEALIRWQHPERGLVPPIEFIPLLEQHPLAITLGDWVIEAALQQLASWNAQGLRTCVSVNTSSEQLQDPDFALRLRRQLRDQPGVQPGQLELEILETGALHNMREVSALIAEVQRLGVVCSLDDFGTGFSSLTFLKQLGAQVIKIDQSFVRGMLDDSEHASIVHSVLTLARSFDRHTLGEGVESLAHGRMLLELGCELAQGYAIARPMPAAEVPGWIDRWSLPPEWQGVQEVDPADVPLLLAEVEHRHWLRDLRLHAAAADRTPPPPGPHLCRFGQWAERPSTLRRFGHAPGFAALLAQHQAFHELALQCMPALQAGGSPAAEAWARLATASEALGQTLRGLRG